MGLATKTESWPGKKEKKKKKKTKQIALPCFFSLLFFPSPKPNKTVCQKLILIKWSHWQVDSSPTKKIGICFLLILHTVEYAFLSVFNDFFFKQAIYLSLNSF